MRRHIVAVLLAASLALVAAVACGAQVREPGGGQGGGQGGGEGQSGPVQLAVVPKAIGFDFWEQVRLGAQCAAQDWKSTRLNSSHANISYAVFCLKKKITH